MEEHKEFEKLLEEMEPSCTEQEWEEGEARLQSGEWAKEQIENLYQISATSSGKLVGNLDHDLAVAKALVEWKVVDKL